MKPILTRGLPWLALAAIVFWASGAGFYLHEHFEAAGEKAEIAAGENGRASAPASHSEHDHDRCPLCQTLHAMSAHAPAMPAALPALAMAPGDLMLAPYRFTAAAWFAYLPARGPPHAGL